MSDEEGADEQALAREQASWLKAAFDAGCTWVLRGPADEQPVEEHAPVVHGIHPDYAFTIQEFRGRLCVVVEFGLDGDPPGVRWLHRFEPRSSVGERGDALQSFQEGVECGWIARSLARVAPGTSPVWTDFSWGHPSGRWSEAVQLFESGRLDLAAELLVSRDAGTDEREQAERIRGLAVADSASVRAAVWRAFRERSRDVREADRVATRAFLAEHRRDDGTWGPAWS